MPDILTVSVTAPRTPLVEKTLDLLAVRLAERGGPALRESDAVPGLILAIAPGIGREGFRIDGGPGEAVRISGDNERGLLYGVGKFLHTSRYAGGFAPSAWRGTSCPAKPLRGMYFATHFHNWYHRAPIPAIVRYIEDLALWGYNALEVWFDMHHFAGIDDPAAAAMLARLRALLQAARTVGMRPALGIIVNEGYASTPPELRATATGRGHYGVELCPATPAGEALLLRNADERFAAFADCGIELLGLWPYDQGGCRCPACAPWGPTACCGQAQQWRGWRSRIFPAWKRSSPPGSSITAATRANGPGWRAPSTRRPPGCSTFWPTRMRPFPTSRSVGACPADCR